MRVLVVEDDHSVAAALTAVLAKHGLQTTRADSGEEALHTLHTDNGPRYDVVLLDLGLPDQDGFEVCSRIRRHTDIPVIMVTARSDVRFRIHGLYLGADDYTVKPYDTAELLARIQAVCRRRSHEPSASTGGKGAEVRTERRIRLGMVTLDLAARRVTVGGKPVVLTRKEFDLLAMLAMQPGVVFQRDDIISEIWQSNWQGTRRTLEVHVSNLRSKLRPASLIETVHGIGYRLTAPSAQ
jgi:DNA-binding response OmpR family regulator